MNNQENISQQELEYARELAAIRRAKKGIGVSKDTGKSKYAQNGGNPNGSEEETVPEERESEMAAQMRRMGEEAAKKVAKEAVKKVAKKALMKVLVTNPYFWAAVGIIAGVILLIMLVVVIVQSPSATTEDEYETYTTEEGEERTIHMPQLKGL